MVSKKLEFQKIEPFRMKIEYIEYMHDTVIEGLEQHIHDECEIYINLSGDVSFMVEDNIYPIRSGSVIITKPYEYHHCIYNSKEPHAHFWILFSYKGNEKLLDLFFNRKSGEGNLLHLSEENTEKLISICHKMCNGIKNAVDGYSDFFGILNLLQSGSYQSSEQNRSKQDIENALNYINEHFFEPLTIKDIAHANHMSVNTLERKFRKALKISPYNYIKNKRLANAVKLLSEGESVIDASIKSGFSDCSGFITLFKKTYGVTPLKFKQQIESK